jgi:hypothetical protein
MDADVLLPDRLNNFFLGIEDNTPTRSATKHCGLNFSVANVSNVLTLARLPAQMASLASRVLRAAGWCVYGHNQSLPIPVCCPHMLQDGHHCSCTQEGKAN